MIPATIVFIYARDGKIKALPMEPATDHLRLLHDGWSHTTTLDACTFIEYLCNVSDEIVNDIYSLKTKQDEKD
jgi:hypothetical protein